MFGRKITLYILIFSSVFFTILLILTHSWDYFTLVYCIVGFLQGGYTAPLCAMFMDVTNPRIGATQYSILTSLANFGEIGIGALSGTLVLMLGYSRVFLYTAWLVGPALLTLYFVKETKQ